MPDLRAASWSKHRLVGFLLSSRIGASCSTACSTRSAPRKNGMAALATRSPFAGVVLRRRLVHALLCGAHDVPSPRSAWYLTASTSLGAGLVRDARRDERDGDLPSEAVLPPAAGGQGASAGRPPRLVGLEHQGAEESRLHATAYQACHDMDAPLVLDVLLVPCKR